MVERCVREVVPGVLVTLEEHFRMDIRKALWQATRNAGQVSGSLEAHTVFEAVKLVFTYLYMYEATLRSQSNTIQRPHCDDTERMVVHLLI